MTLIEHVRDRLRRRDERELADRNAEPAHTVSNQNGEEAERGMHGGGESSSAAEADDADRG
jgi:hypothetical protein